ncbi:MAG: hypothetical protein QNI95_04880 [Desulfobacterales bacterium]|nr:hypothetical protein [Desulfobacterales bacterium]
MMIDHLTSAHEARLAIRAFKIITEALMLRGYYKLGGPSGQSLEEALRTLNPEIYGSMNDPRIIELKGLEYVLDRLPRGIESCHRFVLTAREILNETSFEKIKALKRRRDSYRVGQSEMCFVITRGLSEIYDIIAHMTFLYIEAMKLYRLIKVEDGDVIKEWQSLKQTVQAMQADDDLNPEQLDQAIWNLSIILGRTYAETKATYDYFEKSRREADANNGLFNIIYYLGETICKEVKKELQLRMDFTPSLLKVILNQIYGKRWAASIKDTLAALGLKDRPLHIISANPHSVLNTLYGYHALIDHGKNKSAQDFYELIKSGQVKEQTVKEVAVKHGFYELPDESGAQSDCQIIDTAKLDKVEFHPALNIDNQAVKAKQPVILVMDYAFGVQAFELMDELLRPEDEESLANLLNVKSISVMGKAGILPGKKGDIMLATAHVLEGIPHTYIVENDLKREDFDNSIDIYEGPIVTVLGTSLQNRDVLEKFQLTSWKAVGLEMEGAHYQRAVEAAILRGHVSKDVKVRYAYYASDNPLQSGQTLAAGSLGGEGVRPTYMITKAIIEKILN